MSSERLTLRVITPSKLDLAVRTFLLAKEAERCTAKTLAHYRYGLSGFVAFLQRQHVSEVSGITPTHIRTYLLALQRRGLKDTTQHAQARAIKAWLNWLVCEGELQQSPMRTVAMPRLEQRIPEPFTREEVRRLLAACDRQTPRGSRDYALALVALDTGLRLAELASLKVGQVDMRTGLATVMGKGRKQRQVVVGAKARAAMLKMLACTDARPGDGLWPAFNLRGERVGTLTREGVRLAIVRLGQRAGVQPCGPHRFRRTFALWSLRDGMDLHSLRLLMGHADLDVLQRYLKLAGEDVEKAHRLHSPADRLL